MRQIPLLHPSGRPRAIARSTNRKNLRPAYGLAMPVQGSRRRDQAAFDQSRAAQDGLSATAFPSGVRAMPVEVTEAGAPIVIWRKELRADSGGAGRTQGGLGQSVEVGTRDGASFEVLAMFERVRSAARGRAGGKDGATGTVSLASGSTLRAKGLQRIPTDDRLVLELPGGAGLGNPSERPAAQIASDVAHGRLSQAFAHTFYPHSTSNDL